MKKIVLILLLLLDSTVFADTFKKPNIFILHINGVNVTRSEALINLRRLHEVSNIRSNVITWDFLYNPSHGLLASDLGDVFRQKRQENANLTIDDYVAVYMKANGLSYPVGSKEYISLKEQIKDFYAKDIGFVGFNFDNILGQFKDKANELAASIISLIKSHRDTDNTIVLLIPHSQGNLYANSLRNYLVNAENFPKYNIGIYGIANPADKIESTVYPQSNYLIGDPPDNGIQYITADNDFVINSLRIFSLFSPVTNSPMLATIHLSTCNDFNICHSLINAYLADEKAALAISKKINLFIISLEERLLTNNDSPQIVYRDFNEPVDLIDASNKTLCSAGKCDNDIFGSIFLDSTYFNPQLDGYQNLIFSFPGKLSTGEYSIVINTSKDQLKAIFLWSNALERAYGYYISPACWYPQHPSRACYSETRSMIQRETTAYFYNLAGKHAPFCRELPNVCYNNRFVLGRFVLSLPKYESPENITVSLWEQPFKMHSLGLI